jgi:RimJ/RimL family protein N-acetyltransferase
LFRAYASDPRVVRFVTWRAHRAEGETREFLGRCLSEWSNGTGYPYVIELADEISDPVGMIHLHKGHHGVNFGFLVDWSLDQPEVWRASACCDIENLASARVLEKAGMTFEGVLRRYLVHPNISPSPRDCRAYARVRP